MRIKKRKNEIQYIKHIHPHTDSGMGSVSCKEIGGDSKDAGAMRWVRGGDKK